jgi:hypothetical protein
MKKIIITENQFKRLVENLIDINEETQEGAQQQLKNRWEIENNFVTTLKNLEEKTHEKHPDSIFFVHKDTGKVYMEYKGQSHANAYPVLYFDYDWMWEEIFKKYSGDHEEVVKLLKFLALEYMDFKGIEPRPLISTQYGWDNKGVYFPHSSEHNSLGKFNN